MLSCRVVGIGKRGRGTESSAEIEERIERATREIEASLGADCFDKIILNKNIDDAYLQLQQALETAV